MKKCRFCGAELEDSAKFCLECMRPLEEKTHIETKNKRRLTPVIIISAALAAAILFSAFMIACTRGFGPAAPETSAPDITVENDTEPRETETDGRPETAAHIAGSTGAASSDTSPRTSVSTTGQDQTEKPDTAGNIDSATAAHTVTEKAPDTVPASTAAPATEKVTRPVITEPASTAAPATEPATTKASETEPVTTQAPGTEAPQTTEAVTDAPVSTDTEAVTDDPGDGFVRSMYTIQSADQLRELMIYEMPLYRNDPDCTLPRLSTIPIFRYKSNGWYGYDFDTVVNGEPIWSGAQPVDSIYFFHNGSEQIVIPYDPVWYNSGIDPEGYALKYSYRAFCDMFGRLCNALGLCAYDGEYKEATEEMKRFYNEMLEAGTVTHTWEQTRDLPGFKAQIHDEDGWVGILGRNGLPDRAYEDMLPDMMYPVYYDWTFDITEGPRDIRVTFQLREWLDEFSDDSYYDACILIEYVD